MEKIKNFSSLHETISGPRDSIPRNEIYRFELGLFPIHPGETISIRGNKTKSCCEI